MNDPKFGPTGRFPQGQLGPHDEGELRIGVAHDSQGNVIINFGTFVDWVGFPPPQAIELALSILKHAGVDEVGLRSKKGMNLNIPGMRSGTMK